MLRGGGGGASHFSEIIGPRGGGGALGAPALGQKLSEAPSTLIGSNESTTGGKSTKTLLTHRLLKTCYTVNGRHAETRGEERRHTETRGEETRGEETHAFLLTNCSVRSRES